MGQEATRLNCSTLSEVARSTEDMIIPENYAQITFTFDGNGLRYPAASTLGVGLVGPPTPTEVAIDAGDLFETHILPNLNASVNLDAVRVKFGPNDDGPAGEFSYGVAGGSAGSGAAPNLAYLVQKRTNLGGRRGRGRMYLPGVSEGDVGSDGVIDSSALSALQADLDAFFTAMNAADLSPVLLHNDVGSPTVIQSLNLATVAATQRRRMRR